MNIYSLFNKINFTKGSYRRKFLTLAFVLVHLPLIGVLIYTVLTPFNEVNIGFVALMVLAFTLLSVAITLFALDNLLKPIRSVVDGLENYTQKGIVPEFPVNHPDEIGELQRNLQILANSLEEQKLSKRDMFSLLNHDFRTPLTQTITILDFLKTINEDDLTLSYFDKVQTISHKQLDTITELLKALKEDIEIYPKSALVNFTSSQVVEEISREFKSVLLEKNIQLINNSRSLDFNAHSINFIKALQILFANALQNTKNSIELKTYENANRKFVEIIEYDSTYDNSIQDRIFRRFTAYNRNGEKLPLEQSKQLYEAKHLIECHLGNVVIVPDREKNQVKTIVSIP